MKSKSLRVTWCGKNWAFEKESSWKRIQKPEYRRWSDDERKTIMKTEFFSKSNEK